MLYRLSYQGSHNIGKHQEITSNPLQGWLETTITLGQNFLGSEGFIESGFHGDVPGGPVVKNPPSNSGDVGSIPGLGTKIPYAAEQLVCHVRN